MDLKLAFILVICLYSLTPSSAKPAANLEKLSDGDLVEKFIEFLDQDKQFNELLSKFEENANGLSRYRRQTINLMEDNDDPLMDNVPTQKEGFMDRAAKFMMELLQRFLRWVNTDSN